MVALQIRDVPDEVRDVLAEQAAAQGQSLQAYLLTLVTDEARRARNGVILQRISARGGRISISSADVIGALEAARAERDGELAAHRAPSDTNAK